MISFYSLTAVKKLGTLRVIGLYTSIAFVLVSLSLLSSPSPSDPRKTNHNSCYCLALRACVSPHSVRTARLREDSQRVFHRPPGYRFRYFVILDGISRPPFCITTDLFAGQLSVILAISPLRENKFSLWNNTKISVLFPYAAPPCKRTLKRDRKNKGTTTRTARILYGVKFPLANQYLASGEKQIARFLQLSYLCYLLLRCG